MGEVLRLVPEVQDEPRHEVRSSDGKHKHHKHHKHHHHRHHKKKVKWTWEWLISGYGIRYPVHRVEDLEPNTSYSVRIFAINRAGMNAPYELEAETVGVLGGQLTTA